MGGADGDIDLERRRDVCRGDGTRRDLDEELLVDVDECRRWLLCFFLDDRWRLSLSFFLDVDEEDEDEEEEEEERVRDLDLDFLVSVESSLVFSFSRSSFSLACFLASAAFSFTL